MSLSNTGGSLAAHPPSCSSLDPPAHDFQTPLCDGNHHGDDDEDDNEDCDKDCDDNDKSKKVRNRVITFCDKKCRILTFCDKKCRILTFRDKTE